jgi:hypothetical protein
MEEPKGGDSGSSNAGGGQSRPRGRSRRRTLLNLGLPFVQVDQLVNQAEDAVAVGYQVIEDVVKEIQQGYEKAKDFNRQQKAAKEKGEPAPPIPWEELVTRVQNLQNLAFDATRAGTNIFFDAVKDGMKSANQLARAVVQGRSDVDTRIPRLAGPVVEDPVEVTGIAGQRPELTTLSIKHRGLARLRIQAQVESPLREVDPPKEGDETSARVLEVRKVTFEPATDEVKYPDTSVLTVDVGTIPTGQRPGVYEGVITAKNFELLIASLRVTVAPGSGHRAAPPSGAERAASPRPAGRAPRTSSETPPSGSPEATPSTRPQPRTTPATGRGGTASGRAGSTPAPASGRQPPARPAPRTTGTRPRRPVRPKGRRGRTA